MGRKGFPNILIPLDGSEFAEHAVATGASLARRSGGTLRLAAVKGPVPAFALGLRAPELAGEVERGARDQFAEYLDAVARVIHRDQGGKVETAILQGEVAAALSAYAEANAVDLVVMTTRGRGGLTRWWVGSVADGLIRRSTVPLLLIQPRELPHRTEFAHIMIALDGEISDSLPGAAIALGSLYGKTQFTLVQVVGRPTPSPALRATAPGRLGAEEHAYLERICEELRARGFQAMGKVVVGRDVAAQVLELAAALRADCIAVGAPGADGLADKIVRGSEVPVLIQPVYNPSARIASSRAPSSARTAAVRRALGIEHFSVTG